jgi:hypothetical protein
MSASRNQDPLCAKFDSHGLSSGGRTPPYLSRRRFLVGAATVATMSGGKSAATPADQTHAAARQALARACDYLWSTQQTDGSWRSAQYGVLRSGQALTPFVLHALLVADPAAATRRAAAVDRARDFLVAQVDADGAWGRQDPEVLEYPVYATSYALQCLALLDQDGDRPLRAQGLQFLCNAQYQEANGFAADHPAYGAWGFDAPVAPGRAGHLDLAHTRRALETLRATGHAAPGAADAARRAAHFLARVQKLAPPVSRSQPSQEDAGRLPAAGASQPGYDGGFFFSTTALAANKGLQSPAPESAWRSYATATCDGLLALAAAGAGPGDSRYDAAAAWLVAHPEADYPFGIPHDHPEPWGDAVRFYHLAVRGEAARLLGAEATWGAQLAATLAAEQRADGSFANARSPLMKEDEPLLSTALALIGLTGIVR